jgi:FkbM family methyltransferase
MKVRNVEIQHLDRHPGQEGYWKRVEANEWEPETFDILDRYIKPGKTFIDIGAWNGVLSLYASALGAQVYAVECDPSALKMLWENNTLNGGHIQVTDCAISNTIGKTPLGSHNGDWGNSMSSIIARTEKLAEVEVPCITLDAFVKIRQINMKDVCLVKIDTEGGEAIIIPACKEFLAKYKPTVLLSLHSFWFPDFEKNCTDIIDAIFPAYRVVPVYAYQEPVTLKEHTEETFKKEMLKLRCNDVLLIPKP